MSLFISINSDDSIIPASAPVTMLLKHISQFRALDFKRLGEDYVYVIGQPVRVNLSNQQHRECLTLTEYQKRLSALRHAIPAKAGPDAHGKDITARGDK
jgi:hypothetical protein